MIIPNNLDEKDQQTLIQLIISDGVIFTRVKPILKPEYFDKKFQETIQYLLDFSNEYNTLPTIEQLNNNSRLEYTKINGLSENINLQQSVLDMAEWFCKKRALEIAIEQCYERISKGETSGIEGVIKEAQMVSLKKDLGINYWENTEEWLHKLDKEMGMIPTGWVEFDKLLNGGFSWGQLNYVVSPSGGGKSLCMANLALNWSLAGFNVLYFTLELDKELVGKRIMAMERNVAYSDITNNIETLSDQVQIKRLKDKPGVIQIIDLPRAATPTDIQSCIQNFELEKNIIPEIIIIDYAGIMSPSDRKVDVNNIHLRDKHIAEELREIARERTHNGKKTMCMSASQITKDSSSELEFTQSDVAGGSTLVHTCDNLFSVRTNDAMRQRGEYEFKIIKCRNAGGTDVKFKMGYNTKTLRITDFNLLGQQSVIPTNSTVNNVNLTGALQTLELLKKGE